MHSAIRELLTHVACEVGRTAVDHWGSRPNGKEAMAAWHAQKFERLCLCSMGAVAKLLSHHGVVVRDRDTFHESWGFVFGVTTNLVDMATSEVFGIPRGAADFDEFLKRGGPELEARLEDHATGLLDDLNHGRLKLLDE